MRLALLIREPGVVGQGRGAGLGEPRRQRIDLLSRRAVDDARFAAVSLEDVEELPLQRRSRQDAVEQVRPIEGADQLDRIAQRELRADVAAHARRGRRGIRVDSDAGQELTQPAELTIFRPEVMPPLADAVGFVHGDEARVARGESRQEAVAAVADEPFRRHVQQTVSTLTQSREDRRLFVGGQRAVVQTGRHAVADQRVHLILHQRDQRRHDEGETRPDERRRLEAERLPAAGGHHHHGIPAGENRVHGFALQRPQRGVSPVACDDLGRAPCTA